MICKECNTKMNSIKSEYKKNILGKDIVVRDINILKCPNCTNYFIPNIKSINKSMMAERSKYDEKIYPILVSNIKMIRKQRGYLQKEVAQLLNLSSDRYSKIECGNNLPSVLIIFLIAEILEVSVNRLYNLKFVDEEIYHFLKKHKFMKSEILSREDYHKYVKDK